MPKIDANFCVSIHLVAQYGNFRYTTASNGQDVKVPAKHELHLLQIPPAIITVPDLDYEFFLDNVDDIADSLYFSKDYKKLKQAVDMIDVKKIQVPDVIPVTDIQYKYNAMDGSEFIVKKNTIIPMDKDGELFKTLLSDTEDDDDDDDYIDIDDDDDEDSGMKIEAICRFVNPEFKFQSLSWKTYIDIQDYDFRDKSREPMPEGTNLKAAAPVKNILKSFFGLKD